MRSPQNSFFLRSVCRAAFSLIELLLVLLIVSVLVAMLFSGYKSLIESSRSSQCLKNLRDINVASAAYSNEHNGEWPGNSVGTPKVFFSTELKPYLAITGSSNKTNRRSVYVCPSDRGEIATETGLYTEVGYPLSYGQNGYLHEESVHYTAGQRRSRVLMPSQLMLYMDFEGHWIISTTTMGREGRREAMDKRHREMANAAYADGHVGSVKLDTIWGKGGDAQKPFPFFQGRSTTLR